MQNVTPLLARKDDYDGEESPWPFSGGAAGFASWWVALAATFFLYGSNTLIFFLYTWPFFLALLPVSVLIGVIVSIVLRGHVIWTLSTTFMLDICLFWLLFSQLTGW